MPKLQVAFEYESQHGCVVVRDTLSDADISQAPSGSRWFFDNSSAVLAVQFGVDGPVRFEVWIGTPLDPLPVPVADEVFEISGALEVEDPARVVSSVLPWVRGSRRIVVHVDDAEFPSRVQLVVDPD